MDKRCFLIEELEFVLSLPADDPRRRHLAECPRCRALLASYRQFVVPGDLPAGADPMDAARRLEAALARAMVADAAPAGGAAQARSAAPRRFWWRLLPRSVPQRTALALATALAFVLVLPHVLPLPAGSGDDRILRGRDRIAAGPVLAAPRSLFGGGLMLAWTASADADGYRVVIYDTALVQVATLDAGRDTTLLLPAARLDALREAHGELLWEVIALRGGDERERSRPGVMAPGAP
ncbi:MAG: hypothetical protein JW819_08440 [Candidatus Krumholzibacteriota bacterium]|nr:hypothetical protein [Candidatus Krumholzibacteriota bacterium]